MSTDVTELPRHKFTVDQYERMAEAGVLSEDDRVELLDGDIVEKEVSNPPHAGVVNRLTHLLIQRLGGTAVVAIQNPVRIRPYSEPEPDVVLARPRSDFYGSAHPEPRDTLLVIEVADSSLAKDRAIKARIYASGRVPEYWIIDVRGRRVIVHRRPAADHYREVLELGADESISKVAFPEAELSVEDILGPSSVG